MPEDTNLGHSPRRPFRRRATFTAAAIAIVVVALGSAVWWVNEGDNPEPDLASTHAFDALTYVDDWDGEPSLPDAPAVSIAADAWRELVTRQRRDGLTALSDDDRAVLLQGAIKSYLLRVTGTRRVIESAGHRADVLEHYAEVSGINVLPAEYEYHSDGLIAQLNDVVIPDPGLHHEAYAWSYADEHTIEIWAFDDDATATCKIQDQRDGQNFASGIYYLSLRAIIDAGATFERSTIENRQVEVLAYPYGREGLNLVVWLDAESLYPIRYEFPATFVAETELPERVVAITEFNPPERISVSGLNCE